MSADVQLISDGDGLAVIGEPTAVDRFLAAERLPSQDLGLPRLGRRASRPGPQVAQAGSEIAGQSGRWVELTKESAELLEQVRADEGLELRTSAPRRAVTEQRQDHRTRWRS